MFEKLRARAALTLLPKANDGRIINPFSVISTQQASQPVYGDMTVKKSVREGYKISVYVYRAIRTIVQAASAVPWIVEDRDGNLIKDHPFALVMAKPNPQFSGQDLIEFLIAHLELCGNALWQPLIVNGKVKEIWPVMPDLVKPIPSDKPGEWLDGWQVYTNDGQSIVAPPDQFVHFMQIDPGNPYWGMGPLLAAARTIDTDNEAQDVQKISMQNRATPDGVFTHEAVLTQLQFDEARRQIRENFLQKTKKREPWVLGAGAKWNQMSMTPVEMDFIASRLANLRAIATGFGLDPWWLGDRSASTYNNVQEARKALYEIVILPMLDDIKATLNLKFAPMYGDVVINYDVSKIAALRADYGAKVTQAQTLWAMGVPFEKINERLEMGFEEFPGWDIGYLSFQLAPVGPNGPILPELEEGEDEDVVEGEVIEDEGKNRVKSIDLQSEEQKAAHWKRIDTRRVAWWGVIAKRVEPVYMAEIDRIEKAIKGKAPKDIEKAAAKAIIAGKSEWEKMISAALMVVIEDFGKLTADSLGAGKFTTPGQAKWTFDPFSAAARAWVAKNGTESIVSIMQTDLEDVKRIILAGIDANVGTVQIARDLRKFYEDGSRFKAMRVARTEVSHGAGFGQREAARQSGVVKTHTWLTSRDDRVRTKHIAMEGQTVDFNDRYSDGSSYPGEIDIMCRCVESFGSK